MTRLDYSRSEVIKRAQELWHAGLFDEWGEAMSCAYWEAREAKRLSLPTNKIAIKRTA